MRTGYAPQLSEYSAEKQEADEVWAAYIQEWECRAHIADWMSQTYGFLQPDPFVTRPFWQDLKGLGPWLLSRIWPSSHPELKDALTNFRVVATDLVNVYDRYSDDVQRGDDLIRVEKFYKLREWDEPRYNKLLRSYEFHLALVEDLVYELTRAANRVCDRVRQTLDRSYRRDSGVLLVLRGVDMSLRETTIRTEYGTEAPSAFPYEGLAGFMDERTNRDYCAGSGRNNAYLPIVIG